jgi:PAS domain S-box-containing protein
MQQQPSSWREAERLPAASLSRFGLHPGASWGFAWVLLYAGASLGDAAPDPPGLWAVSCLATSLFPAFTLVGALGFARPRAPAWILPAGIGLGIARAAVWNGAGEAPAHALALLFEPAAALAAAVVIFRAELLRHDRFVRLALTAALCAVALLDARDAWMGATGGDARALRPVWSALAPVTAALQMWAMWFWIARREVRIERAEHDRQALEQEVQDALIREALLREREAWLFDFYEKASEMLLALEPGSFRITRCNRKFSESLGYARKDLVGRSLLDLAEPGTREDLQARLAGLATKGRLRELGFSLLRRDGRPLAVVGELGRRTEAEGGASEIRVVLHDVTRKKREAARVPTGEELGRLVAQMPVGVYQVDVEGRGVYTNERFLELTGLRVEELTRQSFLARIHPADRPRVEEEWLAMSRERSGWRSRYRLRSRDGSTHLVLTDLVPVGDEAGEMCGFLGVVVCLDAPATGTRGAGVAGDATTPLPPGTRRWPPTV